MTIIEIPATRKIEFSDEVSQWFRDGLERCPVGVEAMETGSPGDQREIAVFKMIAGITE
ncbi:MAG: hypothetical protein ACXQTE_01380 [Methanosarcinaceae archaeon]